MTIENVVHEINIIRTGSYNEQTRKVSHLLKLIEELREVLI